MMIVKVRECLENKHSFREMAKDSKLSPSRLVQTALVLKYAPDLVHSVCLGTGRWMKPTLRRSSAKPNYIPMNPG